MPPPAAGPGPYESGMPIAQNTAMVRRYVSAGLAAICLGLLGTSWGCGGSGSLIYASVAIFTVDGTTIVPPTSDVVAGGTVEIDNTSSTLPATVSFSSLYPNPWTIPPLGRTSVPLPSVSSNTDLTLTYGSQTAVLHIHL